MFRKGKKAPLTVQLLLINSLLFLSSSELFQQRVLGWVIQQHEPQQGSETGEAFLSSSVLLFLINSSFHLFIFCTYLVNISGMLFERNVGQYPPESSCGSCRGGRERGDPVLRGAGCPQGLPRLSTSSKHTREATTTEEKSR